jgi:SAM-dependent methyltransferase
MVSVLCDFDPADVSVLDLGCGKNMHPEADIGIDVNPDSDADILCDITEEQLPFEDNSISRVYAQDVIEHIRWGVVEAFTEIHRVLKPVGVLDVLVPGSFADPPSTNPLHNGAYGPQWFYSWDPERREHGKWDNFNCAPFHVTQTNVDRVGFNPRKLIGRFRRQKVPYLPWRATKRRFELRKRAECPRHDLYK